MNYSKSLKESLIYFEIIHFSWTLMFRNTCSHSSTGFAHLKQALLRRRPSGNCEKKIAESH